MAQQQRRGALTDLEQRLSAPQAALRAVGLYMVGQAQAAFSKQGRGGAAWLPRAVPNRIGVLRDLEAGRTPPSRRFDARPAGIDTGRLRQSLAYRVSGTKVTIGSQLPYASDVQRGSSVTIDLDADLRHKLAEWLKGLGKGGKGDAARAAFGPLFQQKALSTTVPPRPFLAITPEDRKTIRALAQNALLGRR